jgi:hypothetical protein
VARLLSDHRENEKAQLAIIEEPPMAAAATASSETRAGMMEMGPIIVGSVEMAAEAAGMSVSHRSWFPIDPV